MILKAKSHIDFNKLKALFLDVSSAHQGPMFNWPLSNIEAELQQAEFWVLEEKSRQYVSFIAYRETDVLEITALATHPQAQQRHLMKALLETFLAESRALNKAVLLEVHEKNDKALQLYKGLGFKKLRERSRYYSDGASALVFHFK